MCNTLRSDKLTTMPRRPTSSPARKRVASSSSLPAPAVSEVKEEKKLNVLGEHIADALLCLARLLAALLAPFVVVASTLAIPLLYRLAWFDLFAGKTKDFAQRSSANLLEAGVSLSSETLHDIVVAIYYFVVVVGLGMVWLAGLVFACVIMDLIFADDAPVPRLFCRVSNALAPVGRVLAAVARPVGRVLSRWSYMTIVAIVDGTIIGIIRTQRIITFLGIPRVLLPIFGEVCRGASALWGALRCGLSALWAALCPAASVGGRAILQADQIAVDGAMATMTPLTALMRDSTFQAVVGVGTVAYGLNETPPSLHESSLHEARASAAALLVRACAMAVVSWPMIDATVKRSVGGNDSLAVATIQAKVQSVRQLGGIAPVVHAVAALCGYWLLTQGWLLLCELPIELRELAHTTLLLLIPLSLGYQLIGELRPGLRRAMSFVEDAFSTPEVEITEGKTSTKRSLSIEEKERRKFRAAEARGEVIEILDD